MIPVGPFLQSLFRPDSLKEKAAKADDTVSQTSRGVRVTIGIDRPPRQWRRSSWQIFPPEQYR